MNRGSAALALCLLVVLSGCSAILGPSGQPADVPGVENGTIADSDALLDAHAESLVASGFRHELRLNLSRNASGQTTNVTRIQRTSVAADGTPYRFELVTKGQQASRFVVWGNETTAFRRFEYGGKDPQYGTGTPASSRNLTGVNLITPHLSAPFEVVETTTTDGSTLVTLESTGKPTSTGAFPQTAGSVLNYQARLVVDQSGRIHRLDVTAEYTLGNQTAAYDVEFEVTSFENADVEHPSWLSSAASSG